MLKKLENFYYFILIVPIVITLLLVPSAFLYKYHIKSLEEKHIEGIFWGYNYKKKIEESLIEEENDDNIPHKEINIKLIRKHYEKLINKDIE